MKKVIFTVLVNENEPCFLRQQKKHKPEHVCFVICGIPTENKLTYSIK